MKVLTRKPEIKLNQSLPIGDKPLNCRLCCSTCNVFSKYTIIEIETRKKICQEKIREELFNHGTTALSITFF